MIVIAPSLRRALSDAAPFATFALTFMVLLTLALGGDGLTFHLSKTAVALGILWRSFTPKSDALPPREERRVAYYAQ